MQRRGWLLLLALAVLLTLAVVGAVFWPWISSWLPRSSLVEAWINYLIVDLSIGSWGPVATLLLVALVELIWALNLGRRSDGDERRWLRLDRLHAKEIDVLNQEIALLKDERKVLCSELELREDLIREEKARLWTRFEDLQRASGRKHMPGSGSQGGGLLVLRSVEVAADEDPQMPPDLRSDWQQVISRLERVEMVGEIVGWKERSALQLQQHADNLLRLGNGCYQLGEYDRALVHFDRILELVPSYLEAYINRAVVNLDSSRLQSAMQDLDRAAELAESPWIHLYRGVLREKLGEVSQALEDYGRAIRLDDKLAESHYRRGLLYLNTGELKDAIIDESMAIEIDPTHSGAYRVRAMARAGTGNARQALEDMQQACKLSPNSRHAYYGRALVRYQLDLAEDALADLDRALELDSEFLPALMTRGGVHATLGNHWQAMADYDQAVELDPESSAAFHARGQMRAMVQEFDRAIEDFGRALELEPGRAGALADLGAALEKKGQHEQAVKELDRALAIDPTLAPAYYARGLAHGSLGEYDRASRDLNKAAELDPTLASKERRFSGANST